MCKSLSSSCSSPQLRDTTGCRIIFPSADDEDQELITIIGKQEGVQKAKIELEASIKDIVSSLNFCNDPINYIDSVIVAHKETDKSKSL